MPAKVSKTGKYFNATGPFVGQIELVGDQVVELIAVTEYDQGNFNVEDCIALAKMRIAASDGSFGNLNINGCIALEEVEVVAASGLQQVNCSSVSSLYYAMFSGASLTEAAVDTILAALDANGLEDGEVDLSGGTSSPPSTTGLTSKSNLEGKGWTVTVNEA